MRPHAAEAVAPEMSERSRTTIRFASDAADAAFRTAIQGRMRAYLAHAGKAPNADWTIWAKAGFWAVTAIAFYAALLTARLGGWISLALAVACGICTLLLAINVSHDAAHGALTGRRAIDNWVHRLLFGLMGVDGYLWQMRHLGSHHVFPNVNGCDIDIDENPFIRLSPNHPWQPRHRGQHLYAAPLYCVTLLHSILWGDFVYLTKTALANMRAIRHEPRDIALFFVFKLAYFGIALALPMLVLPFAWWQVVAGYGVATAAMSLLFIFLLIGTHFSDEADFPQADADGHLPTGWATHALTTSVDWSPESRFAQFFSGGANAHAAHHLFPRLSHAHTIAATRIVRDAAREFGIPYHATTFAGMIRMHFRHLKALGSGERNLRHERQCDDRDRRVHLAPAA